MKKLTYAIVTLAAVSVLAWGCAQEPAKASPSPDTSRIVGIGASPAEKATPISSPTVAAEKPQERVVAVKPVAEATPARPVELYTHQSLATGSPGMNTYSAPSAGQASKLERGYPGAPPQVPHSVAGMGTTKDANSCVSCHKAGAQLAPDHVATKIPDSHYTNAKGEKLADIDGRRYSCLQCHVPQALARPLGGN